MTLTEAEISEIETDGVATKRQLADLIAALRAERTARQDAEGKLVYAEQMLRSERETAGDLLHEKAGQLEAEQKRGRKLASRTRGTMRFLGGYLRWHRQKHKGCDCDQDAAVHRKRLQAALAEYRKQGAS